MHSARPLIPAAFLSILMCSKMNWSKYTNRKWRFRSAESERKVGLLACIKFVRGATIACVMCMLISMANVNEFLIAVIANAFANSRAANRLLCFPSLRFSLLMHKHVRLMHGRCRKMHWSIKTVKIVFWTAALIQFLVRTGLVESTRTRIFY